MHFAKKRAKAFVVAGAVALAFVVFSVLSFAHEAVAVEDLKFHDSIKEASVWAVIAASIIIAIFVAASILIKEKNEALKWVLVAGIILPSLLATFYIAGSTIYLNLVSQTKGPVHWHADYEIWDCGRKIDLIRPHGISNRVGSAVFHEHNDNRIHVEGVVVDKAEVDLHNFFATIGGMLSKSALYLPTDNGFAEIKNGGLCSGKEAKIQVFLYKVKNPDDAKNWVYGQQKLEYFENYVLAPYSNVPPGDCIIIEFDEEKEKTEHICETYKSAMLRGELSGG
ncbi:MAG: hypothetical protein AABX34_01025 [Nanoarchaeota archaeon]